LKKQKWWKLLVTEVRNDCVKKRNKEIGEDGKVKVNLSPFMP